MTLSRAIVRAWMAEAGKPVPAEVMEAARLHMLDAVGVGLAAAALDQGAPYIRMNRGESGGAVVALSGAAMTDPAEAALINGGLIHSLEYDDTHTASIVHGSSVFAAAALAVGQAADATPEAVIRAYLLGYEVAIRIGLAAPGAFQQRGFQITSVAGPLVAALIAADIMDAGEDERVHAVGIALSQASGVFEFLTNGSTVKSMHPGWAAHAGVLAARLARAGLTGPETAIEGTRGLYAQFAGRGDAARNLTDAMGDFGNRWHMLDVAYKFLPCCHYIHPFVEAAGQLAEKGITPAAIMRLTLRIAAGAAPIVCEPWQQKLDPPDGHAARWSLPVVVAARLVEGRVDHQTFRFRAAPDVLSLAGRMIWEKLDSDSFPHAFEAEILCRTVDGADTRVRVADVYGNVARPARRDDILAKFRANAGFLLPQTAVAQIETFFLSESSRSFAPFGAALRLRQ